MNSKFVIRNPILWSVFLNSEILLIVKARFEGFNRNHSLFVLNLILIKIFGHNWV